MQLFLFLPAELSIVNTTFCTVQDTACVVDFSTKYYDSVEKAKQGIGTSMMCPCTPECYEKQYWATLSSTKWPSDSYWAYLAEM